MATIIKIFPAFFILTLYGCIGQTDNGKDSDSKTTSQHTCTPYFDFDKVEHYYLDMNENVLWDTEQKKIKTDKEQKQLTLLIQHKPDKLTDSTFLKGLENFDFVKKEIPVDKFDKINQIFCQRKHKEVLAMACIAVYRDILIFKKENKTIGFAKVCFSCDQSVITGTTQNTDEFGQSGDYKKLYQLLH